MKRDIQVLIQSHAAQAVYDRAGEAEMSVGADVASETVTAPATGEWAPLSRSPLVPDTLELVGLDDTLYMPDYDYYEDASRGEWQNLRIPAGTQLTATYHHEELFAEQWQPMTLGPGWTEVTPADIYREGSRAWMRGVISGGPTAPGELIADAGLDYGPGHTARLWAMTDNGPAVLEVHPGGKVTIYPGPFEPGNGWLSLDGLSWPWQAPAFVHWGQEDIFFGGSEMDVTYAELD